MRKIGDLTSVVVRVIQREGGSRKNSGGADEGWKAAHIQGL